MTALLLRPEFQKNDRHRAAVSPRAALRAAGTKRDLAGAFVDLSSTGDSDPRRCTGRWQRVLNAMKLWAMKQAGLIAEFGFDLDVQAEVFESCAYHYHCLFQVEPGALATLILGGGVPKTTTCNQSRGFLQVLGLVGSARLYVRRTDRERAGDRRFVVVVSTGGSGDVGQGRQGRVSSAPPRACRRITRW